MVNTPEAPAFAERLQALDERLSQRFIALDPNLFRGEPSINSGRLPWSITTLATQHFAGIVITRQTPLINGVAVMLQRQLRCGVIHLDQEIALRIQGTKALR